VPLLLGLQLVPKLGLGILGLQLVSQILVVTSPENPMPPQIPGKKGRRMIPSPLICYAGFSLC